MLNFVWNMSFQDWSALIASVTSIIAIFMAWRESWRNNRPVLELINIESAACCKAGENRGRHYQELLLTVRNLGISLHEVTAHLVFYGPDGQPHFLQFGNVEAGNETAELAKGMIMSFCVKSYRLDAPQNDEILHRMYASLENARKQRAVIRISSQGHPAYSFRTWDLHNTWLAWRESMIRIIDRAVTLMVSLVVRIVRRLLKRRPDKRVRFDTWLSTTCKRGRRWWLTEVNGRFYLSRLNRKRLLSEQLEDFCENSRQHVARFDAATAQAK